MITRMTRKQWKQYAYFLLSLPPEKREEMRRQSLITRYGNVRGHTLHDAWQEAVRKGEQPSQAFPGSTDPVLPEPERMMNFSRKEITQYAQRVALQDLIEVAHARLQSLDNPENTEVKE